MAVVVDTSACITIERLAHDAAALQQVGDEPVAVAAITASELLVGVHRAASAAQRARREAFVEAVLAGAAVLPFDLRCARVHARLAAEMSGRGLRVGAHDLLIAATALAHGFPVLTENAVEFRRVPGLDVRLLA